LAFREESFEVPVRTAEFGVDEVERVAEQVDIDKEALQDTMRVMGMVRKERVDVDEAGEVAIMATNRDEWTRSGSRSQWAVVRARPTLHAIGYITARGLPATVLEIPQTRSDVRPSHRASAFFTLAGPRSLLPVPARAHQARRRSPVAPSPAVTGTRIAIPG
jgi:hypothetical protein